MKEAKYGQSSSYPAIHSINRRSTGDIDSIVYTAFGATIGPSKSYGETQHWLLGVSNLWTDGMDYGMD